MTTDTPDTPKKKFSLPMSEGMLLAAVPIFAYAVSFKYEEGYLDYFLIPNFLIHLSLEYFFVVLFATAAMVLVLINILDGMSIFVPDEFFKKYTRQCVQGFIYTALALIGGTFYHELWAKIVFWFSILYLFCVFIAPFTYERNKSYVEKMDEQHIGTVSSLDKHFKFRISKLIPTAYFILIMAFFIFPMLIAVFGHYRASAVDELPVTVIDTRNFALIRKYDDLCILVGVTYSSEHNAFLLEKNFTLANIDSLKSAFVQKKIVHP